MRSFGTEDRPCERPVAPRDEIYEYIIFRGTDIEDLTVCEPPKPAAPQPAQSLPQDPAIVQVCFDASVRYSKQCVVSYVRFCIKKTVCRSQIVVRTLEAQILGLSFLI